MQSQSVYKLEAQCRASIDNQKKYMFEVANQAGQPKMTILEGTCVNTKINTSSKKI